MTVQSYSIISSNRLLVLFVILLFLSVIPFTFLYFSNNNNINNDNHDSNNKNKIIQIIKTNKTKYYNIKTIKQNNNLSKSNISYKNTTLTTTITATSKSITPDYITCPQSTIDNYNNSTIVLHPNLSELQWCLSIFKKHDVKLLRTWGSMSRDQIATWRKYQCEE